MSLYQTIPPRVWSQPGKWRHRWTPPYYQTGWLCCGVRTGIPHACSGNKPALKATFHCGLNEDILIEMVCRDDDISLDSLIDLAIHLGILLQRKLSLMETTTAVGPMQISHTCKRRQCKQLCFYWGGADHTARYCLAHGKQPDMQHRTFQGWWILHAPTWQVSSLSSPLYVSLFLFSYTI